jgi:hypothetical protein
MLVRINMIEWMDGGVLGKQIRRNHALEHATITLLSQRIPGITLRGRSNRRGFYVFGDIDTNVLVTAAHEALNRLRSGEVELAIHPFCGTNLAVAGTLAGLSAVAATRLSRHGGSNDDPWAATITGGAAAILAALGALLVAQPLGPLVQRYLTTLSDMGTLRIESVEAKELFGRRLHFVRTSS